MSSRISAEAELPLGTRVGRYVIGDPVATGASGAVYRATSESGDEVALKRMVDPRRRARFEIETRLLAGLSHPRVVRILDHFGEPGGAYNIVMELVQGTDLARVLWNRGTPGLPLASVLDWTWEACEALSYVHEQQVVHGDIKPPNLLLGGDGVVLADFGIAMPLSADDDADGGGGTPRFMAPEVFAGDPASPASDIYGLAATLWTLLTGSPPVYGEDARLAALVAEVTPELEEAVRAGLAIDPAQRTPSAGELARALGRPLGERRGASLAASIDRPGLRRPLVESVVKTAAGAFDAAAASLALLEPAGDLVYVAAWGAGAHASVGVRLDPGVGIAGTVVASGEAQAVPDCHRDPRFAQRVAKRTGYVPYTLLVLPLRDSERVIGALSILDRRDGRPYLPSDVPRGLLFCELAVAALDAG
jgi:hypothetical protein